MTQLPELTPAQRTEVELLARGRADKSRTLREAGLPETPESAHAYLLKLGVWDEARTPYADRLRAALHGVDLPVPDFDPAEERLDLADGLLHLAVGLAGLLDGLLEVAAEVVAGDREGQGVGAGLKHGVQPGLFRLVKVPQDVGHDQFLFARMADAQAHAAEIIADMGVGRPQAIMAGIAAAELDPQM